MKVAISSTGASLDSTIDPRFGRCPYLLIVDTQTLAFESIENTYIATEKGAGIGAAKLVLDKNIQVVLTGRCGPNANRVLKSAGIKVYINTQGTVGEAVEQLKKGTLIEAETSDNVKSSYGQTGPEEFGMHQRGQGRQGVQQGRGFRHHHGCSKEKT